MVHNILKNFVLRIKLSYFRTDWTDHESSVDIAILVSFWEVYNAVLARALITIFALKVILFEHEAQLALVVLGNLHKFVGVIEIVFT